MPTPTELVLFLRIPAAHPYPASMSPILEDATLGEKYPDLAKLGVPVCLNACK